ncbi:hypothetical protein QR680_013055 [Steinernema hermaphroditum]|uniref:Uncharacterized protein n=1 Tax=Steinernema hermaphroditum TaxID=289476 RepID=A0AA39M0Y2_9BILA|nr:hypothetical protein QR680_013055 [Steinernema hermaphroditum]
MNLLPALFYERLYRLLPGSVSSTAYPLWCKDGKSISGSCSIYFDARNGSQISFSLVSNRGRTCEIITESLDDAAKYMDHLTYLLVRIQRLKFNR